MYCTRVFSTLLNILDLQMLHNDITASSRTNRSVMLYHLSRLVTSPFHYMEMSSSLVWEEAWQLEWAPPLPTQLNGAQRRVKGKMLDPFSELGPNETFFDNGMVFDGTLSVCFQKLQLLDDVSIFLIILVVLVDVGEKSPVIEVVDSVLKNGICCLVAPEAAVKPGGEWLHWFVRGVIGSSI